MPTIKGGVVLGTGEGIPQKITDVIGAVKLPFTATNFTYSNRKMDGQKFKFSDGSSVECKTGALTVTAVAAIEE